MSQQIPKFHPYAQTMTPGMCIQKRLLTDKMVTYSKIHPQHGRDLATLYLAADPDLVTANDDTSLCVLWIATIGFSDLKMEPSEHSECINNSDKYVMSFHVFLFVESVPLELWRQTASSIRVICA